MAGIMIDDEELESKVYRFVRDKMVQAASVTIQRQAKDIVAGELARLRLADPSSKTLEGMVNDALTPLIDSRLHVILGPMEKQTSQKVTPSAIATELQKQVKAEVDKAIKPLAQQVKDALSEAIAAKIRA